MTIKDREKRKDKAMVITDTDNLWTKIESLQWVLFVIFAIKNDRNGCNLRPGIFSDPESPVLGWQQAHRYGRTAAVSEP